MCYAKHSFPIKEKIICLFLELFYEFYINLHYSPDSGNCSYYTKEDLEYFTQGLLASDIHFIDTHFMKTVADFFQFFFSLDWRFEVEVSDPVYFSYIFKTDKTL